MTELSAQTPPAHTSHSPGAKTLGAWARLYRLALAPTIIWDVAAGFLLSKTLIEQSQATSRWAILEDHPRSFSIAEQLHLHYLFFTGLIVLLIFHGGMALNDWADRKIDANAGRKRPIPQKLLAPRWAFFGGVLPILQAAILAWFLHPEPKWIFALILLVLAYNLGSSALRLGVGPLLLALCRSLSFAAGILILIEPATMASSNARWAIGGYALYVLFLSRLASREEHGGHGMNMLPFVGLMALSPFPFTQMTGSPSWVLYVGWVLLTLWLFLPTLPDRHIYWAPERVQAAVRRSLTAMPLLPAMAVVAAGAHPAWLLVGLAVAAITTLLATKMAPE